MPIHFLLLQVLLSEESLRDRDKSKRAGSSPLTVGETQADQLKQAQPEREVEDRGGRGLALRVTDFGGCFL